MSEDFEKVRKWIGREYEDGRGDEAYAALDRIEAEVTRLQEGVELLKDEVGMLRRSLGESDREVNRLRKIEAAARAVDFHLPDVWNQREVEAFWEPIEALREALGEALKAI